jgi:hypothetical protein
VLGFCHQVTLQNLQADGVSPHFLRSASEVSAYIFRSEYSLREIPPTPPENPTPTLIISEKKIWTSFFFYSQKYFRPFYFSGAQGKKNYFKFCPQFFPANSNA